MTDYDKAEELVLRLFPKLPTGRASTNSVRKLFKYIKTNHKQLIRELVKNGVIIESDKMKNTTGAVVKTYVLRSDYEKQGEAG